MTNARWYSGWSLSWASLFGHLPKFEFECGQCGGFTTARPQELPDKAVGACCNRCRELNRFPGLTIEVGL